MKIFSSFKHAFRGLFAALKSEVNFRIEVVAALVVIATMLIYQVEKWEAVILIITIFSVLVLEVLNTVLERLLDLLKPEISREVKVLKDMMAGAVFLTAVGAAIVGFLIFWDYI